MEVPQFKHLAEIPRDLINGKIVGHNVVNLTAPGENYWSAMLKLDLEVDVNGEKEVVHTVAKCLPAFIKPGQREMALWTMENEVGFYNEVIPLFKEFQRENGVKEADFFTKLYIAKLVAETDTSRGSSLILENLIVSGFKNEDRFVGFDLETAKAILKRLAVFHATFLALKLQKPDDFEKKVKPYTKPPPPPPVISSPGGPKDGPPKGDGPEGAPPPFTKNERFQELILENAETAKYLDQLNETGKYNPFEDRDRVPPEPWSTVIHSDFWVNNIMVKHIAGEESQVKFVDFQMCQYKPFVADLLFFMFSSVQNHVQLENYEDLLRYYYKHFTQTLEDLKVELSLTYEQYLDLIQEEGGRELCHALFFSYIVFGKKGGDHDQMNDEDFDHLEHFKVMMEEPLGLEQKDKIISIVKLAAKLKILL